MYRSGSSSKAARLALGVGWTLWLCVAGTVHATDSDSVGVEAEQAESAAESGDPVAKTEDAKALLERARAYWDLRVARSKKVYEFYPPEKLKSGPLPREFGGVSYRDYEIKRVITDGDRGMVLVRTQQALSPALAGRAKVKDLDEHLNAELGEEWVRVEGTWYKKPKRGGLSRFMGRKRDERGAAPGKSETPPGGGGEAPGDAGP